MKPALVLTTLGVLLSTQALANPVVETPMQIVQRRSSYQPIPNQYCKVLRDDAVKALATKFTLRKGAFTDYITGEKGTGCIMEAKGTGAHFRSPSSVVNKLKAAFVGWEENSRYQADGAAGKAIALTRDQALLLLNVEWEPARFAKCPKDKPISGCNLKPTQQLYTIKLQVAMK